MCMFRFKENFKTEWLRQAKEKNICINLYENILNFQLDNKIL